MTVRIALVLSTLLLVTGCGGGDDDSSGSDSSGIDANGINGIYVGGGNEVGFGNFVIVALVDNGRIQAASDTGVIYNGSVSLQENNRFSSSLVLYDDFDSTRFATASLNGNYVAGRSLTGSYSASTNTTGSVNLDYSPDIYERSASLDLISGSWMVNSVSTSSTVTFEQNGDIFGTDSDGCVFSGSTTVPNTNRNMYKVSLKVENCGEFNGSYSGLGALSSADASNEFVVIATNANYGFAFDLIR